MFAEQDHSGKFPRRRTPSPVLSREPRETSADGYRPCVVGASFQSYHWIYWLGPLLGSMLAAAYYHFIKFFNYEEVRTDGQNGIR